MICYNDYMEIHKIENKNLQPTTKTGFTLVELLVVIAILAILTTAVVLVLNPAELIKQGRDSTRISDLAALNSALALYAADVSSPSFGTCTSTIGRATVASTTASTGTTTLPFLTRTLNWNGSSNATSGVTGNGWVDVNFNGISGGTAPLSKLPIDPINNATYFYGYACNNTLATWEIDANMESTKYANSGGNDVEINTKDGGDNNNWYELGNDPGLDL